MNELPISDETQVQRTGRNTIFVGILPPREVAGDLGDLSLSFREDRFLKGNPRPTSHLHLTLFHVGNFPWMPEDIIAAAQRACGAVAERSRSFPLQMDQATCMGKDEGNVPFVLESQRKNADLLLL